MQTRRVRRRERHRGKKGNEGFWQEGKEGKVLASILTAVE